MIRGLVIFIGSLAAVVSGGFGVLSILANRDDDTWKPCAVIFVSSLAAICGAIFIP